MSRAVLAVVWYRFRATFRSRWTGLVSLVLLIGLVGGIALGSLAAARRTQSSFSIYLASTNPADLGVTIYGVNGNDASSNPNYSAKLTSAIAHLPHVRDVAAGVLLQAAPLRRDGSPRLDSTALAYPIGSVNGLFFNQDRVTVTQGRMANPDRPDEIMMTSLAAHQLGFHVGQTIPYGIYSQEQQTQPGIGTPRVAPAIRFNAKLVGLATQASEIVEDDIDRIPTFIILTPALTKEAFAHANQNFSGAETFGIQTDHGASDLPSVESELAKLIPRGVITAVHATAPVEAKADRAIKPIAIALGVFGGVALLAALLIASQAISRRLRVSGDDVAVLRALGAGPATTAADGLIGILGAVVLGSLLAMAVSVALSPLSPLGPVRAVYPARGIAADWTVLGFGVLVLIGGLSTVAVVLALSLDPPPHP